MDPIEIEFDVACGVDHAFDTWARRTRLWWPRSHTVSGDPGTEVVIEPRVGGRIYERTPEGAVHDWGEVITWEPPRRIAYLWHLMFPREDATRVEVTFTGEGDATRVRIVHDGWERLGDVGAERRERNRGGWAGVIPHYVAACAGGGA